MIGATFTFSNMFVLNYAGSARGNVNVLFQSSKVLMIFSGVLLVPTYLTPHCFSYTYLTAL